jgi:arginine utilization protein RocB
LPVFQKTEKHWQNMTKKATMKKVDKNGRELRLYPYFFAIPPFSMMKKVDKNGRIVKAISPIT